MNGGETSSVLLTVGTDPANAALSGVSGLFVVVTHGASAPVVVEAVQPDGSAGATT
jgi:hypothetical protein